MNVCISLVVLKDGTYNYVKAFFLKDVKEIDNC